ncbi:MAG: thrombospondin type 3 repeat-containing protein, partial [Candidatus Kariarchaeaceae archaeon]
DGLEWQIHGTDAGNWDTDNDTFSDGLEILVGTDPLTATNETVMFEALDIYRGDLLITSPIETTYETDTLTITTTNMTAFSSVKYRFAKGPTSHEYNLLTYNPRQYQYESALLTLPKGSYLLEVIGTRIGGTEEVKRVRFYILMKPLDITPLLFGGVIGFGLTSLLLSLINISSLQKILFWKKKEGGL